MHAADEAIEGTLGRALAAGHTALNEIEALGIARALGLGVPVSIRVRDAAEAARADLGVLGGDRIVVKAVSRTILHKTEVGAVRIVPAARAAVAAAIEAMASGPAAGEIEGFSLNRFMPHDRALGSELLLGLRDTEEFGPVVTLGPGGVHAEFLAAGGERPLVLSPAFDEAGYIASVLETKRFAAVVLGLVRGTPARIERRDLVDLLRRWLDFARRFAPPVVEFEINPLIATPEGPVALDAVLRLGGPRAPRPEPRPIRKLGRLLAPRSIAVVGVSNRRNPGRLIVENLIAQGFAPDRIHIVRPGETALGGCPCHPDIGALPEPVDLCVLSVDGGQVPALVEQIVAGRKAESVIVIPGGLGETAGTRDRAERLRLALKRSRADREWEGPVLNGGNCLGVRSVPGGIDTSFIPDYKLPLRDRRPAPLAVLSQSGAFGIARASKLGGLDPRYLVSIGNQIDLTLGDYLTYLRDDAELRVFACYVEGFRPHDGMRWLEAAAEITAQGRTVILYRAGRTDAGRQASASHTASIAGDPVVTRELAEQAGVVLADSLEEFEDLTSVFCHLDGRKVAGLRLGAMSNAGFECVAFADHAGRLTFPELHASTRERLGEILAAARLDRIVEVRNPLDVTPILGDAGFEAAARALLADPGVDVAVVGCVPLTGALNTLAAAEAHPEDLSRPGSVVAGLVRLRAESVKPWVAVVDAGALYDPMARALERHGVPTFRSADRALRALERFCLQRLRRGKSHGEVRRRSNR